MRNPKRSQLIEEAIKFLVFKIDKSGDNPKPVVLHSIRVGLYLDDCGYNKEVVIAGVLHDLLEDSETIPEEIKDKFGQKVTSLVQACSFDKQLKDKKKRYFQSFERCLKAGRPALLIKAADFLENSYYYQFAEGRELKLWLLEKLKHFLDHSEKIIGKETVWQELGEQHKILT
ncbi:MAG: HD domain-containing protein [Candidatus Shapirobacteria bacterium]